MMDRILYECEICSCLHLWQFNGDCRDDANRYGSVEDFCKRYNIDPDFVEVRSMDERVQADLEGRP